MPHVVRQKQPTVQDLPSIVIRRKVKNVHNVCLKLCLDTYQDRPYI